MFYASEMPWKYGQTSGELSFNGVHVAFGYSGKGPGKNNSALQAEHNVGPIPRGKYNVGPMIERTAVHGPYVLPLTPARVNCMFGRSGFLIHGDSVVHPGEASEGCIILGKDIRLRMAAGDDKELLVVA